jgi:hypothetical protein
MGHRGLVWVLGLWCAACGGSEQASPPPSDAGADQAGGASGTSGNGGNAGTGASGGNAGNGGSGGSGGSSGSAGSGGSAGAGGSGAVVGDGYIFAQQSDVQHFLSASFDLWQPMPLCTFRNAGPCRLDLCAAPTAHADAGEVAATVGTQRRVAMVSMPGVYSSNWGGQLWQPGDSIQLTSAGAEGPAVNETVIGPGPFTLIEPAPASTVGASQSRPFRARWSGGANGSAVVAFSGRALTGETLQVKCSFDAAPGEGEIPAGALAELDPAQRVTLVAFAESYKSFSVDGWLMRVAARTASVSASVTLVP